MFVEDGAPQMSLLGEFETDEPSGLEVFFPVKLSDVQDFQNKAIQILSFMADKIEVKGVFDIWLEELVAEVKSYEWVDAPYIGRGYQTSCVSLDTNFSGLRILQGNVAYEINRSEVSEIFRLALGNEYDGTARYLGGRFYLNGVICVPNGTFVPHPSRERLTFDDLTKEKLKSIFSKVFQHFVYDEISLILGSVKTYYELYLALREKPPIVQKSPRIADFIISSYDRDIPSAPEKLTDKSFTNFYTWRIVEFSGVTVTGSRSEGYRFKQVSRLTMMGSLAERIYLTNKYPLSTDYRYRLIKDMQRSGIKKAIILSGRSYEYLFRPSDESLFVDVQSLPKLTQAEQVEFKQATKSTATGVRVTKEEVSFVTISNNYGYPILHQKTADEVIDAGSKMRVMWIGSNRRYEFPFGDCVYKLKQKEDLKTIYRSLTFYFNWAKNMIPNWKEETIVRFGIAVLPEGHQLRSLFPELMGELRSAALFEVNEFLKTPRFFVRQIQRDLFIEYLRKNPLILNKLLEGWSERSPFDKWLAEGMPKGEDSTKKPYIPFSAWNDSDVEMKEARILYNAEQNCTILRIENFYNYVSTKYPLLRYSFSWGGVERDDVAVELIEYFKFKFDIKSNEE
jgi:hypothetical protein